MLNARYECYRDDRYLWMEACIEESSEAVEIVDNHHMEDGLVMSRLRVDGRLKTMETSRC